MFIVWLLANILGFLLIVVIIILFVKIGFMENKAKTWTKLFHLYLALISLGAFITLFVSGGIMINETFENILITDAEYLQNDYRVNSRACNEDNTKFAKKKQSIEDCQKDQEKKAIAKKELDYKKVLINGGTWFIIALIIFLIHYPAFRRTKKEK